MVLGEAFVYDEQKFPPQVGLDITVPWRVVPGDLSFRALLFLVTCFSCGVHLSLKLQPLSSSACWYGGIASLKTCSLDEMSVCHLLMFHGMFFSNAGAWLLSQWTYNTGQTFVFVLYRQHCQSLANFA